MVGAFPGAYIDVTIPGEKKGDKDATPGNNLSCCAVRKTTVAAGVIGGICGAILVGPIGCLAGGVLLARYPATILLLFDKYSFFTVYVL